MEIKITCDHNIELVDFHNLNVLQGDLKTITEKEMSKLIKRILQVGFRYPFFVWDDKGEYNLLDGTHRLKALELLEQRGYSIPPVPVVFIQAKNVQEAKEEILAISSQYAKFDKQGLYEFSVDIPNLSELLETDFSLPEIDLEKFNAEFFDEPKEGLTDDDQVPEVEGDPVTQLGDLWILGEHRVLCADSTVKENVDRLMDSEKADVTFTSPPYNGDTHLDYGKGNNKKLYENDTDKWTSDEYIAFCHKALENIFNVTRGFVFWNVMYNAKSRHEYIKCIYPHIEKLWETIAWKKTGMPISNGLTRNFELIFCFKNGDRKHLSSEFKTESNHWEISNIGAQNKDSHRACYPVGVPEKGVSIGSSVGDIVFDPFLGSGSTLIACQKLNRKLYGIELSPAYVDIIINRWQEFTGHSAILESTGESYNSIVGKTEMPNRCL
jgi:DNA modification methylase